MALDRPPSSSGNVAMVTVVDEGDASKAALEIEKYPGNLPLAAVTLAGIPHGEEETKRQRLFKNSLLAEFAMIQNVLPSGVYVFPSQTNPQNWDGCVFLRQGWYKGGLYQFTLDFPELYPSVSPSVRFTHTIPPHPLINRDTGELDMNYAFSKWSPEHYSSLHILTWIKKIFYDKDTFKLATQLDQVSNKTNINLPSCFNPEILHLFDTCPSRFLSQVEQSALTSFDEAASATHTQDFCFPDAPLPNLSCSSSRVSFSSSLSSLLRPSRLMSNDSNHLDLMVKALQAFSIEPPISHKTRDAFLEWIRNEYLSGLHR